MRLSLIVCTHNPRSDYLARTLSALSAQTLPRNEWELLVVDNGSDADVASVCDLSWHPGVSIVREHNLGVAHARVRGLSEARGELLVYVDDDTMLGATYLEEASAIACTYPHVGAFGAGYVEPVFEIPPEPEIKSRAQLLGVRATSSPQWSNHTADFDAFPWGSGLCIRRRVADEYPQFLDRLGVVEVLGRKGERLFSAEDDLFSWVAASVGLGFGIFPQLRVTHLIAATKLNRGSLLRLIHDHSFSHAVLDYVLVGTQPTPADSFRLVHLLLHGIRNGLFSMQCRWAALSGQAEAARFVSDERLHPSRWTASVMECGR